MVGMRIRGIKAALATLAHLKCICVAMSFCAGRHPSECKRNNMVQMEIWL